MITYKSSEPFHLAAIRVQEGQKAELRYIHDNPDLARALVDQSLCLTGIVGGLPVAVAGFTPSGAVSYRAWAFFSPESGPYMLGIARKALVMMASLDCRRVDITVNAGFTEGERFARILGMRKETSEALRFHGVLGEHQNIYAKVR